MPTLKLALPVTLHKHISLVDRCKSDGTAPRWPGPGMSEGRLILFTAVEKTSRDIHFLGFP